MFYPTHVIAQLDTGGSDTVSIVVVGFLFVMIVLAALAAVTTLVGTLFSRAARDSGKTTAVPRAQSNPPEVAPEGGAKPESAAPGDEDPVLIAVISAAVHTALGERPHRVVSIRQGGSGWAQEGRRQIFSSHRVR